MKKTALAFLQIFILHFFQKTNNQMLKKMTYCTVILTIGLFNIPVQACNIQPLLEHTQDARVSSTRTGIFGDLICLGCSISNPENVVGDPTEAAEIDLLVGVGLQNTARVYVASEKTYMGGHAAGFMVGDPLLLGILEADLLQAITITTYGDNGGVLEIFSLQSETLDVELLVNKKTKLVILPELDFNHISIEIHTTLLAAAVSMNVYHAFGQAIDTDGDGVSDAMEDTNDNCVFDNLETDPNNADTDNDGLIDGLEDLNSNGIVDEGETDPRLADTDSDGLPDGVEDANQNGVVDEGETDPKLSDSDADGLMDGLEDLNQNGTVDIDETDPNVSDTDNDGLMDGLEDLNQNGTVDIDETDPNVPDTDNDGLMDGAEDLNHNAIVDDNETDPRVADTDADNIPDGIELENGSDPVNACSPNANVGSCSDSDALAVTLIDFNATIMNNQVVLNWTTSDEHNFIGFIVESTISSSSDFISLKQISAQGSAKSIAHYQFQEPLKEIGTTHYYRLKMLNTDGSFTYSKTLAVKLDHALSDKFAITPNPATSDFINLSIGHGQFTTANVVITNTAGQPVFQQFYNQSVGKDLSINIATLSGGIYWVAITTDRQRQVQQLVVK